MNKLSHFITDKLIAATGIAAVAITACMPAPAAADTLDDMSVVLHVVSKHGSTADNYKFNEVNPGVALKLQINNDWSLQAGGYKNSYYKPTVYAVAQYTPLHIGNVSIGGFAGVATGYTHVSQLNIGEFSAIAGLQVDVQITNTVSLGLRAVPRISPKTAGVITAEIVYKF